MEHDFIYTGRGTTALWLILKSLNKSKGVIMLPINVCEIVISIILGLNIKIVFYDVDEKTGNATLENIKDKYNSDINIILVVHNFGMPLEMNDILLWLETKSVFIIEDVCNSLGATYKNKKLGTFGDAAIFSFGYGKIVEHGIGGALSIKDKELRETAIELNKQLPLYNNKFEEKNNYFQKIIKNERKKNSNETNFDGIYTDYFPFLLYKINNKQIQQIESLLKKINENLLFRKNIADYYRKNITSKIIHHIEEQPGQIYWRYNILIEDKLRDIVLNDLLSNNVWASKWYPPLNIVYKNITSNQFSSSLKFYSKILNLFIDYNTNEIMIKKTIKIINKYN